MREKLEEFFMKTDGATITEAALGTIIIIIIFLVFGE